MDLRASQHKLTFRGQLTLSFLWFPLNIVNAALLPIVIPTQILLYVAPGTVGNAQQATFLSWLSALSAVLALFIPPVIGLFSDHTSSTFGRRRPYIAVGTIFLLGSLLVVARAQTVVIFILGFALFQLCSNGVTAAYQSLLPDMVPQEQHGKSSAYVGLMTILGNVISLILAALLLGQINLNVTNNSQAIFHGIGLFYGLTGLTMVIGVLITVIGVHEEPFSLTPTVSRVQKERLMVWLRGWAERNWVRPWRSFNFTLVFFTRFAVMMGLALFMTFIEYFFANVEHSTNFVQATASVAVLALLGAVASAFGFGVFSDRVKRAPLICGATICMALAALSFVFIPGTIPLWPLGILFGLGYGAYTSVDWALSMDALPSMNTVGKDLGLWTASATLPAIFAPLLGGIVISLASTFGNVTFGYRLIFAFAALFLVLGAIFILYVREKQPVTEQVQRVQQDQQVQQVRQAQEERQTVAKHQHVRVQRQVGFGWKLAFQTRAGKARGFLRFWPVWDKIMLFFVPVQSIPQSAGLFRVHFGHYHGRPIDLPGNVHVQKGDPIVELHFSNTALLEAAKTVGLWGIMQMMKQDLRALALWVQQPDFPGEGRVLFGVTLLSRGGPRLGFTVRDRPKSLHTLLERFFMMGLMVLYNENGIGRLNQGTTYGTYQQEAWMTFETLQEIYLVESGYFR
jgi:MFS family permease